MKLRDYQERAVSETIKGFNKSNKQLIVLPTGSGKTFVIWNIIKRLGVKAVVFVNTKEILQHTIATWGKAFSRAARSGKSINDSISYVH